MAVVIGGLRASSRTAVTGTVTSTGKDKNAGATASRIRLSSSGFGHALDGDVYLLMEGGIDPGQDIA
jgi:hypothetical protein